MRTSTLDPVLKEPVEESRSRERADTSERAQMSTDTLAAGAADRSKSAADGGARRRKILRWIYLSRVGLAGGVFAAAVFAWSLAAPVQTLTATLVLLLTVVVTPLSYWYSHVWQARPSTGFVYSQAAYDVFLVTTILHLTGGTGSVVSPLYILLISAYTLILPLRGGLLTAGLACIAYIADATWGQGTEINTVVTLQLAIFASVALVVGLIGTKLRETGAELTSVEHELEQLRLETGDILRNIPTAVMTVDGAGRLAYANPSAEELLGIDAASWLDEPFLGELSRLSADLARVLQRTREFRVPVSSAEIYVRRNGKSIPVGVSTAVLDRSDGSQSVTAIMRDISDRKRLEDLRSRAERLEAVAELSASLAHEIRNPLASISSSVQQLGLHESADEDDRLLAGLVVRESDWLSRLLSEFIEFSRVRIVRSQRLDLREVVDHALDLVRRNPAYDEAVVVHATLDPDPVLVDGDEDLLHRVVTNLVLNAVQAAEPGRKTRIDVEVSGIAGDHTVPGIDVADAVVLRVTDDGPGIPEENLNRIFDPFFSGRSGGTGLGLSIVHRAVEAHGGTVLVESTTRKGTRFTVLLPGQPSRS